MAVKQTAGRRDLGEFAPKFAELNDDILFGEVWSREEKLSLRDRSLVTVVALMAQGLTDSSFQYHLITAKQNGVTRSEIAEILTHAAFYAGWPKAWAAFRIAKEVWKEEEDEKDGGLFGLGEPNVAFAQYFVGKSYLKMLTTEGVPVANVTFERDAEIIGIFTERTEEVVRFFFARPDGDGTRNGERRPGNCIQAMW